MGVGLGGFLDGIVLHQILQWHHLLTDEGDFPMDTVQGLEDNTVADGFFHVATWAVLVVGMMVTINAWQRRKLAPPWRSHFGMLLVGWASSTWLKASSTTRSSASTTSEMTSVGRCRGTSGSWSSVRFLSLSEAHSLARGRGSSTE
jgi:hypothetical protein